jgi:hypothetical protein
VRAAARHPAGASDGSDRGRRERRGRKAASARTGLTAAGTADAKGSDRAVGQKIPS